MKAKKEVKRAKKFLKRLEKTYTEDMFDVFRDSYEVDFSLEELIKIQNSIGQVEEMVKSFRKSIKVKIATT